MVEEKEDPTSVFYLNNDEIPCSLLITVAPTTKFIIPEVLEIDLTTGEVTLFKEISESSKIFWDEVRRLAINYLIKEEKK